MIEAVNSVISNAQATRNAVAQNAAATATVADIQTAETGVSYPRAPFISPYVSFDTNYDTAVLQIRDSVTGDVLRQIPTEKSLELRQLVSARRTSNAAREAIVEQQQTDNASSGVTQPQQTSSAPSPAANAGPSLPPATLTAQAAAVSPSNATNTAGAAQVAIAAFSAGAQSGQGVTSQVDVTA